MANCCSCTYAIVGEKRQVKSIYNALKYMNKRKTSIIKNGWGKLWLGNLITKLGGNWEKYSCRGEILDFDYDNEVLTINMETAWTEQDGVRIFLQLTFPDIKIYYIEEESGFEIFQTNDTEGKFFPERFYLDSCEFTEYYENIEQVAKDVAEIVGHPVEADFDSLVQELEDYTAEHEEEDEECYYNLYKYEITES